MQVRARSKHRASIPFRPLFTVLLLSLPVVFIFFFSVLLGNDRLKTEATTIVNLTIASNMIDQLSTSSHDTPIVTYEKVLEYSGAETYRYAAFFNEAGSKKPLSIRHWAELMTHNSTEYSSGLGRDLSFILKVCGRFRLSMFTSASCCFPV